MVNRRVTSPDDPLVRIEVLIPRSAKGYLDTLGVPAARTIRELIDFHRQRPMEKMQVVESIKDAKINLAMGEARLKQIEETESLAILQKTDLESKKKRALEILIKLFTDNHRDFNKFKEPLNHWAGVLQIPPEDLQTLILEAIKVTEVRK